MIDTLRHLHATMTAPDPHPGNPALVRLRLLIGSTRLDFSRWKDWQAILELASGRDAPAPAIPAVPGRCLPGEVPPASPVAGRLDARHPDQRSEQHRGPAARGRRTGGHLVCPASSR